MLLGCVRNARIAKTRQQFRSWILSRGQAYKDPLLCEYFLRAARETIASPSHSMHPKRANSFEKDEPRNYTIILLHNPPEKMKPKWNSAWMRWRLERNIRRSLNMNSRKIKQFNKLIVFTGTMIYMAQTIYVETIKPEVFFCRLDRYWPTSQLYYGRSMQWHLEHDL